MNIDELRAQIAGLQITIVPTHELMPYPRNTKEHPEWQVALIASAIREFGWLVPAVVRPDGVLAAGHGRVLAALRLGLDHVPCISAAHLTETQIRAFALADNRLAELAPVDKMLVIEELREIQADGFDIKITGFDKLPEPKETKGNAGDGNEARRLLVKCPECAALIEVAK